ncbi:hypothetical protein LTR37_015512 [Vermiconidia calcicola]|uniref:Uncharacterized protein n=1 Tax=Vermiconidia calcicola TaxID=1690605 RepID=A0ACC3MQU6_9PEZI|nr:hypothetical protein LTR37_015512 [Vermiconidia calcicola]
MNAFVQQHFRHESSGLHLDKHYTWANVLEEARLAQERYEAKEGTKRGRLSLFGRKAGEYSSTITPALQNFLPNGDYTGIVCGSVILVLKAFESVAEVRKMVMDTLSDAPPLLENVDRMTQLYPNDTKLQDQAAEMKDRVDILKSNTEKLKEQASLCDKELTHQILAMISHVHTEVVLLGARIMEAIDDMAAQFSEELQSTRDQWEVQFQVLKEAMLAAQATGANAVEALIPLLLLDAVAQCKWHSQMSALSLSRATTVDAASSSNISAHDVVSNLGDWRAHNNTLLSFYSSIASDCGPDTVAAILVSPEFHYWLSSSHSGMLVIEYDLVEQITQPGSIVVASLFRAITQVPGPLCLVHFCCQQGPYDRPDPIINLLSCLISSLLQVAENVDLRSWSESQPSHAHHARLEAREFQYLCSLLKNLVNSLPSGAIFCLIDDFQRLEAESDRQSLCTAFCYLQNMVFKSAREGDVVILKFLITTPLQNSIIFDLADRSVRCWHRVEPEHTRHLEYQGFDAEQILSGM